MASTVLDDVFKILKRHSKTLNSFLKLRSITIIFWFIFGVILGFGLHEFVIADLEFNDLLSAWLGLTICLILAIGNAFSTQIRCISLLTLPSICGHAGRNTLKALVLTFILAGPIKNLTINAWEVIKVFSCSTELTYNLSKTRLDLMHKPFQEDLLNMKEDITEVKNTMKTINGVIGVLSNEIEDEHELNEEAEYNDYIDEMQEDSKRSVEIKEKYTRENNDTNGQKYKKEYLKKLETRCEEVLTHGTGRCRNMFKEAYNRCYDKVSWLAAWLLCWPMKLTFVCNLMEALGGGAGTCDATKEVEPGFGESFAVIKDSENLLEGKRGQVDDVKIKYQPIEFHSPLNVADAKEAAESLEEVFRSKKTIFDTISVIIRRLLSIIFLRVLIQAQEYHDNYLDDINHDNCWVTSYFCHIDARRQSVGKMTLLPFKKAEKDTMCSSTSNSPHSSERKAFVLQFAMILLETLTATVFVLLDKLLNEILLIVHKHSIIDYTQTGKHNLIVTVKGTGMMARLIRSLLEGFNIKQQVYNERSNFECLPNPNVMSSTYLIKIYGTYFIIWILVFLEGYTQKFKRIICSTFYKKREKQRVLFLYNQSLKKRANYIKNTKAVVKERVKENKLSKKTNVLLCLRLQHPKYFAWLSKITVLAQLRCLVCGQNEGRFGLKIDEKQLKGESQCIIRGADKWHVCETSECHALYCKECWQDIENICCVCSVKDSEVELYAEDPEE